MRLLNEQQKPQLCASKDETRPHLNCLQLDVEDKCLVATDGHRLVCVPVEVEADDMTGALSVETITEAQRLGKKTPVLSLVRANGKAVLSNGASYERPDVQFPPWRQVAKREKQPKVTIGLNAHYLWEICQALGGSKNDARVKIEIWGELEGFRVTRNDSETDGKAFAILMPARV